MFGAYAELKKRYDELEYSRAQVAANLTDMAARVHVLSQWITKHGGDVVALLEPLNKPPSEEKVEHLRAVLNAADERQPDSDNDNFGFSLN